MSLLTRVIGVTLLASFGIAMAAAVGQRAMEAAEEARPAGPAASAGKQADARLSDAKRRVEGPSESRKRTGGRPREVGKDDVAQITDPISHVAYGLPGLILGAIGWAFGAALSLLWGFLRWPLIAGAVLALGAVLLRVRGRYATPPPIWFRLMPHEGQVTDSAGVITMFNELTTALRRTNWEFKRAYRGAHTLTLACIFEPDRETGVLEPFIAIGCPRSRQAISSIHSALRSSYEDMRFEKVGFRPEHLEGYPYIVRLKRAQSFTRARLVTPNLWFGREAPPQSTLDRLTAAMDELQEPAIIAQTIMPAHAPLRRWAQSRLRWRETGLLPDDDGEQGEIARREIIGASEAIGGRGLFVGGIRVLAKSKRGAMQLASKIQGTMQAEGEMLRRPLRNSVRRALYRRRIELGLVNPLPSLTRDVYSSAELAALWRMPTQWHNAGRIERDPMPRLRPPKGLRRVAAEDGIVLAEEGREANGVPRGIALWPEDWMTNLGLLGTIGAGKTWVLARAALHLARTQPDSALFVVDPKGDLTTRLLSILEPSERPVYVIDAWEPEIGFLPLRGQLEETKKVESMLATVIEMHRTDSGDAPLQAAGLGILRTFVQAAVKLLPDVVIPDVESMLSVTEDGFKARKWTQNELARAGAGPGLVRQMREIAERLNKAEGAYVGRLDAPHNKLGLMTMEPMCRVLQHPVLLDPAKAIEERAIVVLNGRLGTLNEEPMVGLCTAFLAYMVGAVLRQQDMPEEERVASYLILDEAQFFLQNQYLQSSMATARSAGLRSLFAFHHLGQLAREADVRWLTSFIRSWFFMRIGSDDAKDMINLLQSVHFGRIGTADETLDKLAVNPHALTHAPMMRGVGTFVARGRPSPAFTGAVETLPTDERLVEEHLGVQRDRAGARPLSSEDLVLPTRPWGRTGRGETTSAPAGGPRRERSKSRKPTRGSLDGQLTLTDAVPTAPGGEPQQEPGAATGYAAGDGRAAQPAEKASEPAPPRDTDAGAPSADGAGGGEPAAAPHKPSPAPLPRRLPEPSPYYKYLARYEDVRSITSQKNVPEAPSPVRGDRGRLWEVVPEAPQPDASQLKVMLRMHEFKFLARFHVEQMYGSARTAQRALKELLDLGLVHWFSINTTMRGRDPRLFWLTRAGFELLKITPCPSGQTLIDPAKQWKAPDYKHKAGRFPHDIETISWALAFEDLVSARVIEEDGVMGSERARRRRPDGVDAVALSESWRNLIHLDHEWHGLSPDVAFGLDLGEGAERPRLDLLVEYQRTVRRVKMEERIRNYDAFHVGWRERSDERRGRGRQVVSPSRYGPHRDAITLWVLPRWRDAFEAAALADRVAVGTGVKDGETEAMAVRRWESEGSGEEPYRGRRRMYFTWERLIHQRALIAYSVPSLPPALRVADAETRDQRGARGQAQAGPVVELLPRELLRGSAPARAADAAGAVAA